MPYVETYLGAITADAEDVTIQFSDQELTLGFRDYVKQVCKLVFSETLAFRWQEFDESDPAIDSDKTYEVTESEWLQRQANLQGENADHYKHFKLCFNACGTLDILAKSVGSSKS
ncbi:MAG TPA: hypothetical protein V6C86_07665 [Oculatellaceae cyanobacterium]